MDDIGPLSYIALPVPTVSYGDHCTVRFKPHCVRPTRSYLDNVRPTANITRPVGILSFELN
ncbi:MAG TPA: hypothetical protein VMW37_06000 [Dehalococcoidales bacterium]|nr:hypothetical protein [Dehalococcoidales bacterium]